MAESSSAFEIKFSRQSGGIISTKRYGILSLMIHLAPNMKGVTHDRYAMAVIHEEKESCWA